MVLESAFSCALVQLKLKMPSMIKKPVFNKVFLNIENFMILFFLYRECIYSPVELNTVSMTKQIFVGFPSWDC